MGGEDFVAPRLYVISEEGVFLFFFSFFLSSGKEEKRLELQEGICFFFVLNIPSKCLYFSLLLPLPLPGRRRGEREDESIRREGERYRQIER